MLCTQLIENGATAYPTAQLHTPMFRQEKAIKQMTLWQLHVMTLGLPTL